MTINEKDQQLIAILRENARLSVSDIARRLNASRTSAQVRLEKLERSGVIAGYTVRLSPESQANQIRALVMIKSTPSKRVSIEDALSKFPDLVTLSSISGQFDLAAEISSPTVRHLDTVLDRIGALDGVDDTLSSIILSTKIER